MDSPQQCMTLPSPLQPGKAQQLLQPMTPFRNGEPKAAHPDGDLILLCVDYFTRHLYGIEPIVDRDEIEVALKRMKEGAGVRPRHLVWALCAYVLLHPRTEFSGLQHTQLRGKDRFELGRKVLGLVCQERVSIQPSLDATVCEEPRLWSIIIPLLVAGAHSSLQDDQNAWNSLREATWNAYSCGIFHHATSVEQSWVLHLLLFVNERLYALKLLRLEQRLPLTVIPPVMSGHWEHRCEGFLNNLILAYSLVSQVGHQILNGVSADGVMEEWQGLELDVIQGLSWRNDERRMMEARCLQHWVRTVTCPRMLPHQGLQPSAEWRNVVIATLQDTLNLIRAARTSGLSGALDVSRLCDIAVFGLDIFESGYPDSGILRYVDRIVTEVEEMKGQGAGAVPSLADKLYHIRSKITSIHDPKQALVSCAPVHLALNNALQGSIPWLDDRGGLDSPGYEPQKANTSSGVLGVRDMLC